MSIPVLSGIDHVHVYVKDRPAAVEWYSRVLGFEPVEKFAEWATETGPLTLADDADSAHLALFISDHPPTSTIAFGATGEQFLAWRTHLEAEGLELRVADHKLAWSMYFYDPAGNYHEITTYDTAPVAAALA
jgi:catechol 2,3-dioxygenase-like lactoylglutathione lyase family enzyme